MRTLKQKVKLYESFIKEKKVDPSPTGYYARAIIRMNEFIEFIETGKMTPEIFDGIKSDRDKWDVSEELKNVTWCCGNCKNPMGKKLPSSPFFDGETVNCSKCDHVLTRRTPGGQSDPFGFTFIRNVNNKNHK